MVVSHMDEGGYFGEVEMVRGGKSIASVRATPHAPVEVLALDRDTFIRLLEESEVTREAIEQIAETRLAENIDARAEESS